MSGTDGALVRSGGAPVLQGHNPRNCAGSFLARQFPIENIENKDVFYVATAPSRAPQKFFGLLGSLMGPLLTGFVAKEAAP